MPTQDHSQEPDAQHPRARNPSEPLVPIRHQEILRIPPWVQIGDLIRHERSGYEYVVQEGDAGRDHYFEWMELPSIPAFYGFPVEEDDEMDRGTAELRIDGDQVAVTITGIGTDDEGCPDCGASEEDDIPSCETCGEDHGDHPDPHPAYVFPEVIEGTMANARAEWGRARREAFEGVGSMELARRQDEALAAGWPRGWMSVGATEEGAALDHWVGQGAGVDPAEPVTGEEANAVEDVMERRPVDYIAELLQSQFITEGQVAEATFRGPAGDETVIHEGETVQSAVHRILTDQMPGVYRWQQQAIARYYGVVPGLLHAAAIAELPSGLAAVARYTPPPEADEWAGLPVVERRQADGSILHISEAFSEGSAYIMTSAQLEALAHQHLNAMRRHQREIDSTLLPVPRPGPRRQPRQTHRDRREAMDRWLSGAGWHTEDSHQLEASDAHMAVDANTRTELCWASLKDFSPCNERAETEVGLCAYHAEEMRDDGEISGGIG